MRSTVTSRKFTVFLFAFIVNLRLWSLNVWQMYFLIFSISLGVLFYARPSSQYRPMSFPTTGMSFDSRYKPTSSHVSAPSKLPIVTSKSDFVSLLHHAVFPLKSIDSFALMMMFFSSSVVALNKTPGEIENIKKYISQRFKEHNLKLTIEANKKTVNFLDVTLDLNSSTYKPYTKLGNVIQYVNRESNHPPSFLRSIPEAINKRLSNISSDKHSFDLAVPPYEEALRKSGYDYKLNYNLQPPKRAKNRSRNITWYNPPFNSNVSRNVGQKFLLSPHHTLHKILNKNTLKISYSSIPNVSSIITAHNKRLLKNETYSPTTATCNCRKSVSAH